VLDHLAAERVLLASGARRIDIEGKQAQARRLAAGGGGPPFGGGKLLVLSRPWTATPTGQILAGDVAGERGDREGVRRSGGSRPETRTALPRRRPSGRPRPDLTTRYRTGDSGSPMRCVTQPDRGYRTPFRLPPASVIFPAHGERLSVSVYRCSGPEEARERSDAAYSVAASRARAAAFMWFAASVWACSR
jgi:hypothetical protein